MNTTPSAPRPAKGPVSLKVLQGLPGSGKSTWAIQWVGAAPDERARVNRDDIRRRHFHTDCMLMSPQEEDLLTSLEVAMVEDHVRAGRTVVIDDTNLSQRAMDTWRDLSARLGVELEVVSFNHIPVHECIQRVQKRAANGGHHVPAEAILAMALSSRAVLA